MTDQEIESVDTGPPVALNQGIVVQNADDLYALAGAVVQAGMVPRALRQAPNPQTAVYVVMATGMEQGITGLRSLQSIGYIDGRAVVYGDLPIALARKTPKWGGISVEKKGAKREEMSCTVTMKTRRKDGDKWVDFESHTETITWQDVLRAKWHQTPSGKTKPPYENTPMDMLFRRASTRCLRILFPEVLTGVDPQDEVNSAGYDGPREPEFEVKQELPRTIDQLKQQDPQPAAAEGSEPDSGLQTPGEPAASAEPAPQPESGYDGPTIYSVPSDKVEGCWDSFKDVKIGGKAWIANLTYEEASQAEEGDSTHEALQKVLERAQKQWSEGTHPTERTQRHLAALELLERRIQAELEPSPIEKAAQEAERQDDIPGQTSFASNGGPPPWDDN